MIDTSKQSRTVTDGSNYQQRQVRDYYQGSRDYNRDPQFEDEEFVVQPYKQKGSRQNHN